MSMTITSDYMSTVTYMANNVQSLSKSSEVISVIPSSTESVNKDSVKISTEGEAAAGREFTEISGITNTQTEIQKNEKLIVKTQQEIAALTQINSEQPKARKIAQLAAYQAEQMIFNTQNSF